MKKNKFFLGLATIAAAAFAFTGCSSDELDNQTIQKSGNKINFTYGAAATRTVTDPQSGTSVSTGLNVGIFGVSSEGTTTMTNYANNKYVTAASNAINLATGSSDMTWPTTTSATASIYAYAPYQESWEVNTANSFSVQSDQTSDDNYLASDLLYASATDQTQNATVNLAFSHKLSKVSITIKKATGSNVTLNGATVKIKNTQLTTSLNPSTGALGDASGEATDITAATIASELEAGNESSTATACAVIVPQTLAAGTAFVEITTTDSKTLIGKLSEATTFASSNSYSMTISVGTVTEATTEVNISLGSTSLVQWTDNSIGLTAYTVGDSVLKDGTFIKAADYAANSSNVAAIIFSTSVSETDATAGYNAYAMGLTRYKDRTFPDLNDYKSVVLTEAVTTYSAGYNDLDGRKKTKQMTDHNFYNSGLDNSGRATFVANLTGYTPAFEDYAINTGKVSGWFLPSFGQMRQILSAFGEVAFTIDGTNGGTIAGTTVVESISSGSAFFTSANDALTTLVNNLNTHVSSMFAAGNVRFATSTENGGSGHVNKFWCITTEETNKTWSATKGEQRSGSSYNVIPVVAVKLPAVSN